MTIRIDIGSLRLYANPLHNGWGVLKQGLDGWWDSPDSRDESDPIPGSDGSFEEADPLVDSRRVTIRGAHLASSPEWSVLEARTALAALVKSRDLSFRVWEAGRWMSLRRARIRGRVRVTEGRANIALFELTVGAADPRKYGAPVTPIEIEAAAEPTGGLRFPVVDRALDFGAAGIVDFPGVFRIHNPGTASFFPERFTARGPLDGFTITSESHVIEYGGPVGIGEELVLSPYAGGRATLDGADVSHNLLRADWVAVQPGETRGYLFTPEEPQPGSKLTIEHPDGAWW